MSKIRPIRLQNVTTTKLFPLCSSFVTIQFLRGRRGRGCMVVGFTTTYATRCLSPLTL